MKLDMSIEYEVSDTTPEVEEYLEAIVGAEARTFAEQVRRRLAEVGVESVHMSLNESAKV